MSSDEQFMQVALAEARIAAGEGEVPVGAVAVFDGEMLVRAHNRTIALNDPTAHAEMLALRGAAARLGNYRLTGVDLYVTLEPCAMCAGALVQARIQRLVYGADDPKAGAVRSCARLLDAPFLNHRIEVDFGVLGEECGALLQEFFLERRTEGKLAREPRR
jgi:tRNA(adenine34) deaminase